jgi:hypothetical protein
MKRRVIKTVEIPIRAWRLSMNVDLEVEQMVDKWQGNGWTLVNIMRRHNRQGQTINFQLWFEKEEEVARH